jgi:sugar lactone lactonase YvrE
MTRHTTLSALMLSFVLAGCAKDAPPRARTGTDPAALAKAKGAPAAPDEAAELELVATFTGPMPTGVAVSPQGRVFVNFPRWGDPVDFTVAEVKDGQPVAYPDAATNRGTTDDFEGKFVSVQSVVVDPAGRLWVVDTGSTNFGPVTPGAARLFCYDLSTDRLVKTIPFPPDVVRTNSYTNDIRFDLARGAEGMAYLTDSSLKGDNGLIVVDLASGKSWRRLDKHPSTLPEPNFAPTVEGQPLKNRPPAGGEQPLTIGSDGIAVPAGGRLYYCPLAGRRLYSVSLDALSDPNATDEQVVKTVEDLGDRGFASDGLEGDAQGRVYLTDYENNAVRRRDTSGRYEILAQDPRLIWPDSLALAPDGSLYVTANQLNRQPQFHRGQDLRKQPYALFRFPTDARPVQQGLRGGAK